MSEDRLDLVIADLRKQVLELSAEVTALTREVKRIRISDGMTKSMGTIGGLYKSVGDTSSPRNTQK
jgi:hypothetical protein